MSTGNFACAVMLSATVLASAAQAATVGACRFDIDALTFAGPPAEQAKCLLRHVEKWGKLGPALTDLPPALSQKLGKPLDVTQAAVRKHLTSLHLTEAMVGGQLSEPVSRARDNQSGAPKARYFVIHDTSAPWFGNDPFPDDIDTSAAVNRLSGYGGSDSVAHMFVNRRGDMLVGHKFSVPWRATKLETQAVGLPAKGLFLHIESIQPRRRDPSGGPKNDAIAPDPGFTAAQYDRLALLYVVASLRAGQWLIPAFHAAMDEGISDAHDDPQNFALEKFDAALGALLAKLKT